MVVAAECIMEFAGDHRVLAEEGPELRQELLGALVVAGKRVPARIVQDDIVGVDLGQAPYVPGDDGLKLPPGQRLVRMYRPPLLVVCAGTLHDVAPPGPKSFSAHTRRSGCAPAKYS